MFLRISRIRLFSCINSLFEAFSYEMGFLSCSAKASISPKLDILEAVRSTLDLDI